MRKVLIHSFASILWVLACVNVQALDLHSSNNPETRNDHQLLERSLANLSGKKSQFGDRKIKKKFLEDRPETLSFRNIYVCESDDNEYVGEFQKIVDRILGEKSLTVNTMDSEIEIPDESTIIYFNKYGAEHPECINIDPNFSTYAKAAFSDVNEKALCHGRAKIHNGRNRYIVWVDLEKDLDCKSMFYSDVIGLPPTVNLRNISIDEEEMIGQFLLDRYEIKR